MPSDISYSARPTALGRDLTPYLHPVMLFIVLATVGAQWMPIFAAGSIFVELSNFGVLVTMMLAAVIVWSRGYVRLPSVLIVLLLLQATLMASFLIRGDPLGPVIMSTAGTLCALAVTQLDRIDRPRAIFWAFVSFMGFLVMSVVVSGVDIIGGFIEFLNTGSRERFFFFYLRPVYNAFRGPGDLELSTVLNNSVAATFAMFFMLSGAYAVCGNRRMIPVAAISFVGSVMLFSSSAMLAVMLSATIMGASWLYSSTGPWRAYIAIAAICLFAVTVGPKLVDALLFTIAEDGATRESRLGQYQFALDVIDDHLLRGIGLISYEGALIHNLFLFSFVSAGLLAALFSGWVILAAVWIQLRGTWVLFQEPEPRLAPLLCACLPILFLVRVMFAGAGGLPGGAGVVSFALALVAARELPPVQRAAARGNTGI